MQFRALRSEHAIASSFAAQEAEAYGAEFAMSEVRRGFAVEQKALESWKTKNDATGAESASGKRPWSVTWEEPLQDTEWTRGERYGEKQREGLLPDYHSASAPAETGPSRINVLDNLTVHPEESLVEEPVVETVPAGRRLFA